jgi:16S rRNA (guanine1516-N2)-methyltransferase
VSLGSQPGESLVCLADAPIDVVTSLTERYGLLVVGNEHLTRPGFHLVLEPSGLFLQEGAGGKARVQVDFAAGANAHRRKFGGGLGQDIAKAVGVTGRFKPRVLDATAGLGRDSFVLGSLGCSVLACERHPVVAALLEDGLQRAARDPDTADIVGRITLKFGPATEFTESDMALRPEVVYLDPMFADDAKGSAQVKKDMQAFRTLVGADEDADDLLDWALSVARCRVVIKRGRKAAPLGNRAADYSITGKSNRFDVFSLSKVAPYVPSPG